MPTELADGLGLRDVPLLSSPDEEEMKTEDTPQGWFPRSSFSF
jgi:hypothetical protein